MKRTRGVALIIALLMVAIGTLVIAALIDQNQMAVARTRNMLREQQAFAYARGLEDYAFEVLRRDEASGDGIDSLNDPWSKPMPPVDIPGGRLAGRMRDLNGRLNINALVSNTGSINGVQRARLQRLLLLLEIKPELDEAIIDWIDADSTPQPRGAEDPSYLLLDPPYRAANRPLRQISELRLIRGFDDESFQRLEPYVSALPSSEMLNVNTAPELVLQSLVEGMSKATAARIYNKGRARFRDAEELRGLLEQEGLILPPAEQASLGFKSQYFLAESMIELDGLPLNYFSLIERQPGSLRVIARSRGGF